MLPGIDGFEVCRLIRHQGFGCPILMLTAKGAVNDRVKGLKAGADDYLCKPFAMQELMARVEALLRRLPSAADGGGKAGSALALPPATSPDPGTGLRIGGFFFDQAGRCLRPMAGGPATDLSTTEFRLLAVLASNPGRVMSREELLDSAWGYNNETTSRTVDVHIAWLRTKLGEGDKPRHIVTVRRGGYKLVL
jgi:DNA-binding response OmpR family regulator